MGLLDSLGVSDIGGGIDLSGAGRGAVIIFVAFFVLLLAGIITFLYYSKKVKKTQFKYNIPIFTKIHGKQSRIGVDHAKELFIPDSNISLFFLKNKKIYIARPTRSMGKNEFWYSISENGEWINFDMSTDPEKNTLATANYDHRDTRYAYVNLTELIKRNYKDKSVQWWKEYSPLITFIIVSFIFIAGSWILISRIGKLIEGMGPLLDQWTVISESMAKSVQISQNLNSGIVPG